VDRLAVAGVFVGATEAWLPGGPPLPPADAVRLEQCRANVVRMQRAGVRVVCSSEAGVGSAPEPDLRCNWSDTPSSARWEEQL
jgi:hypothetical protein